MLQKLSCQTNGTDVLWLQGFSNFSEMTQRYNHFAYLLLLEKLVRRSATRDYAYFVFVRATIIPVHAHANFIVGASVVLSFETAIFPNHQRSRYSKTSQSTVLSSSQGSLAISRSTI